MKAFPLQALSALLAEVHDLLPQNNGKLVNFAEHKYTHAGEKYHKDTIHVREDNH